jgi:biotin carboxyl carrier protein
LPNGEISVNGRVFHVDIIDPRSFRGRQSKDAAAGKRTITAPMPGRVIRILVDSGQTIVTGQGLIVVEAMKMQNEMKAPQAGTVTQIRTSVGATVGAGDVLLVIE